MKIAVLLSGGVDSSVALNQVKKLGFTDITAYYLKIWLEDDVSFLGNCPWDDDISCARAACQQVGIELKVLPLQLEYYDKVVSYALSELKKGRTPSPDIFCNQRIKFGAFYDAVDETYDKVVTGHYSRVEEKGYFRLFQSPDPVKDQSYFLSRLNQTQLSKLWFPLGGMRKTEVRRLAEELDLPNKDRKDSQGICFLGKIKYPDFVRHYLGEREGKIIRRETGEVLGTHRGFWFYTIGQRSGLGLGNGPWYVTGKNTDDNIVFVTCQDDMREEISRGFFVEELSWIDDREPSWLSAGAPDDGKTLRLKLRHGPKMVECTVGPTQGVGLEVHMAEGDRGLAPGQFAVFYVDDECMGSGKILRPHSEDQPLNHSEDQPLDHAENQTLGGNPAHA